MESKKAKKNFKEKFINEFTEYLYNFAYMAIIFSAIILYRRLVLAQHGIILEDYFVGVFKAFVIAKVVMIGAFLNISKKFENKPLILPVLYKAILFTIMVMVFDVIEIYIKSLFLDPDFLQAFIGLNSHLTLVWIGGAMLIFFIFIPFFAFKELIRVMGIEKIRHLFLKNTSNQASN